MKGSRFKEKRPEPIALDLEPCPLNLGSDFTVRPMIVADLAAVITIEAKNPSPWTAGQLADELDQESGWRFVAEADTSGLVCAFACGRSCLEEAELLKIVVDQNYRRRGVATKLMAHILGYLAEQGVGRCFLELRASNLPALALYERFGFRQVGLRKNYYASPLADAILMEKAILVGTSQSLRERATS